MLLPDGVVGDAAPPGRQDYRDWLSRTWNEQGGVALVIGINPNDATDSNDDQTTRLLTTLLCQLDGVNQCGSFVLVNCFDRRSNKPEKLKELANPISSIYLDTVQSKLSECDFVVASWGTKRYDAIVANARARIEQIVTASGKRVICFSRKGIPIHCSPGVKNRCEHWSDLPFPWRR
jgi:hypothetical protein